MKKQKIYLWVLHPCEDLIMPDWGILKGENLREMIEIDLNKMNKVTFLGISPIETFKDMKTIYGMFLPSFEFDNSIEHKDDDKLTKKGKLELLLNLARSGTINLKDKDQDDYVQHKLISIFDITKHKSINLVGYHMYE